MSSLLDGVSGGNDGSRNSTERIRICFRLKVRRARAMRTGLGVWQFIAASIVAVSVFPTPVAWEAVHAVRQRGATAENVSSINIYMGLQHV